MDKRILDAMRLMERRMDSRLVVEQVAAELGLSIHHFHRLFQEQADEAPASFLRRIRLDAAALRLKWGNEDSAAIAISVGYDNRPAFIRAFKRQFGITPAHFRKQNRSTADRCGTLNGHKVGFRELDSIHLLAKRYVGDVFRIGQYWADFLACLPRELTIPAQTLYVGLLHDDFRVTDPERVRYDCAITLADPRLEDRSLFVNNGLFPLQTTSGVYATIDHRGHFLQVPETYDLLCHRWLIPNGFVPGHDPAIEIHSQPRCSQDPTDLSFTIMFPVE